MLVALQMISPWVQSYKLVAKNTGRFQHDLAMGTVIQICDGKCWSLCKWPRHGHSHTYLWRKMLVALQMTSPWVQAYKILQAKRVPLQWEKNKSWACPYSKMCKTWWDFDDFSQKPAFCLVGAHITQVQNNKSQPKRPQPFPRAYFGLLSWHLFSSMKIKVFTQPNAFRR